MCPLSVASLLDIANALQMIEGTAQQPVNRFRDTTMKAIGIIGAGQMGAGIALVSAQSGFQVFLADICLPEAEAGKANIATQISRLFETDKMDAKTAEALLYWIESVADYASLASADSVIAAATDREDIRRDSI